MSDQASFAPDVKAAPFLLTSAKETQVSERSYLPLPPLGHGGVNPVPTAQPSSDFPPAEGRGDQLITAPRHAYVSAGGGGITMLLI